MHACKIYFTAVYALCFIFLSLLVFHSNCVDEWLMKWNKVCPICKREIPDEKIRNLVPLTDTETTASTAAVSDNNNTSDTENVPLLLTLHGPSMYGSVGENNDEGFNDQHLLEPAVHTSEQYQLRSSSGSSDGLSDAESEHSVAV